MRNVGLARTNVQFPFQGLQSECIAGLASAGGLMVQVLHIYPRVTHCSPAADVAGPLTAGAKTSIPRMSSLGFPRNGWFVRQWHRRRPIC